MGLEILFGTFGQVILGGALVGLALVLLMILTGRVMSASKMIGSLLGGQEGLAASGIAFIAGLFIAPIVLISLGYAEQPPMEPSLPLLAIGGVLVGIGARLGGASVLGEIGDLARRSGTGPTPGLAILAGLGVSLILHLVLRAAGLT